MRYLLAILLLGSVAMGTPVCTYQTDANCNTGSATCSGTISLTAAPGDLVNFMAQSNLTTLTHISSVTGFSDTLTQAPDFTSGAAATGNVAASYTLKITNTYTAAAMTVVLGAAPSAAWRVAAYKCTPDSGDSFTSLDASTANVSPANSGSFTPASLTLTGTGSTEIAIVFARTSAADCGFGSGTPCTISSGWTGSGSSVTAAFTYAHDDAIVTSGNPPTLTYAAGSLKSVWEYMAFKETVNSATQQPRHKGMVF